MQGQLKTTFLRLGSVLKCSCIGGQHHDSEEICSAAELPPDSELATERRLDTVQDNPSTTINFAPVSIPNVAGADGAAELPESGPVPTMLIDMPSSTVIHSCSGTVIPHALASELVGEYSVPFPVIRAYEISLSELEDATFDMLPVSTPCTFRFIDCRRLGKQRTLVIYETLDIPGVGYMLVSYPWVGILCNEQVPAEGKTFKIACRAGASGDPISISILNRISFLAMAEGADFLWLDRLCIRQGDPVDHRWQVNRMCSIIRSCQECVVLPGGVQRLANVYEETPWITRAWTLPEILAAPKAQIVTTFAPTPLDHFLLGATDPLYGMRLFGRHRANHRSMLVDALSLKDRHASDKQQYFRNLAIWRCALARTALEDEDLLPSVLGLFDTSVERWTLDSATARFKEEVRMAGSSDLRVISFRDAVLYSGQNVSPQWQRVIYLIAPTLVEDKSVELHTSQPHTIDSFKSSWGGFPVNKAYEITLSELENTVHDISSVSTPCTFRLLDCKKYIKEQVVTIYETPDIPKIHYAAVSYPWVGTPCHFFTPITGKTFKVMQGAGRLGDSLNPEMIRLACILAVQEGADFLWVDRLCIRQMDSRDKAWQITQMYDVYKSCRLCIVFPGGLQRLAGLDEETPWVTRMWTLQEALVPPKVLVLYSADPDTALPPSTKTLTSTGSGVCYSPLEDLLPTTMAKKDIGIRLFGHASHGYALLLRDALSSRGQSVSAEQRYQRYLATWRSAVTRSSDRPQDLLLSTMGLFDISIPEGGQRSSATIISAFVNEFKQQGISDVRVVAFRDAVRRAEVAVTSQWRQLIEEFDQSLPLIHNGLGPTPDNKLSPDRVGQSVARDSFGRDLFLGSALLLQGAEHSLHPCKIVVSSPDSFTCLLPYDGQEKEHEGRWELKPFLPEEMEWVITSHGKIPTGREPVEGGYEKDARYRRQRSLYYALATVTDDMGDSQQIPGKTGHHLGGCCFGLDDKESFTSENYMILCWKEGVKGGQKTGVDPKLDDAIFWSRPNLPAVSFPGIRADR